MATTRKTTAKKPTKKQTTAKDSAATTKASKLEPTEKKLSDATASNELVKSAKQSTHFEVGEEAEKTRGITIRSLSDFIAHRKEVINHSTEPTVRWPNHHRSSWALVTFEENTGSIEQELATVFMSGDLVTAKAIQNELHARQWRRIFLSTHMHNYLPVDFYDEHMNSVILRTPIAVLVAFELSVY